MKNITTNRVLWGALGVTAAALSACSTLPDRDRSPELAQEDGYFVSADEAHERGGVGNYVARDRQDRAEPKSEEQSSAEQSVNEEMGQETAQADPAPVPLEEAPTELPQQAEIYFDSNQASLSAETEETLRNMTQGWDPGSNSRFIIQGFADRPGSDSYNEEISRSRAEAVRDYLVSQGVNRDRIELRAFGEEQAEGGSEEESNPADRRVQILTRIG